MGLRVGVACGPGGVPITVGVVTTPGVLLPAASVTVRAGVGDGVGVGPLTVKLTDCVVVMLLKEAAKV